MPNRFYTLPRSESGDIQVFRGTTTCKVAPEEALPGVIQGRLIHSPLFQRRRHSGLACFARLDGQWTPPFGPRSRTLAGTVPIERQDADSGLFRHQQELVGLPATPLPFLISHGYTAQAMSSLFPRYCSEDQNDMHPGARGSFRGTAFGSLYCSRQHCSGTSR
jgi:hypothetical protein